ncbi:MAG: very short patch repair endonuclease [Verrucomicrobiota bacterium]
MVNKDRLTKARRSWNMSRIRGKDTTPEKVVTSLLLRMGYRFRLHGKKLPGRPDVVLPKHRLVVFVHGCFWHRHSGCRNCTTPTNNQSFWVTKLEGNAARDMVHARALRKMGWRVIVVWECETETADFAERVGRRLAKAIGQGLRGGRIGQQAPVGAHFPLAGESAYGHKGRPKLHPMGTALVL